MAPLDETNQCPPIFQGSFSNPLFVERAVLITYALIFLIGLVGNIMTIVIIKYNTQMRTPTNFYLLNLAISDLMILMCNLPLEMIEIYSREWPLSVAFCKLRNICAEFFTCSSILTILAFSCERYFAIVHPINFHQLSHFRRAQKIIIIIWLISLIFCLPIGLSYDVELSNISTPKYSFPIYTNNSTSGTLPNHTTLLIMCKSCVPKKSVAKLLSAIVVITSFCFFYFPMIVIAAIYLFIGKALRRASKHDIYWNPIEQSSSSQSSNMNMRKKYLGMTNWLTDITSKDTLHSKQERSRLQHNDQGLGSYSLMKIRARRRARQVVVRMLVAVVIAFFVCYAPLYLQRLLSAIIALKPNLTSISSFFDNTMAYLFVISGVTFYFGSVINPILYNVVSNKYRRAFCDLFCCRLRLIKPKKQIQQQQHHHQTSSQRKHEPLHYLLKQRQQQDNNESLKIDNRAHDPMETFPSVSLLRADDPTKTMMIIRTQRNAMLNGSSSTSNSTTINSRCGAQYHRPNNGNIYRHNYPVSLSTKYREEKGTQSVPWKKFPWRQQPADTLPWLAGKNRT